MDLRLTVSGRGHISQARRGVQLEMSYLSDSRVLMRYKLPLGEIVTDFYDEIKSISAGYVRSGPPPLRQHNSCSCTCSCWSARVSSQQL